MHYLDIHVSRIEISRHIMLDSGFGIFLTQYQQGRFELVLMALRKNINILQCLSRMLRHFFKIGNHKFYEHKICLSTFYANKLCKNILIKPIFAFTFMPFTVLTFIWSLEKHCFHIKLLSLVLWVILSFS